MILEAMSYPPMGTNITKKIREPAFKAMASYDCSFYCYKILCYTE